MKVGMLTLPLHVNYGAVLQAYALQQALKELGHDPILLDIRSSLYKKNSILSFLSYFKALVLRTKARECEYGNLYFERFVDTHLNKTKKIRFKYQLDRFSNYDAYVVGSDQVWRSDYALNIELFYLDFVGQATTKLSYAASFGKSEWGYNALQTKSCSKLLKRFHRVSVREESAVELVRTKLGGLSDCVLDPTMIIPLNKYNDLICEGADNLFGKNDLFCYVLDLSSEKRKLISMCAEKKSLNEVIFNDSRLDKDKMSIENWLQGIRDSRFIITDSFHGMVFCILFNKEFIVLANRERGYERFSSLLGQLGLLDRLISDDLFEIPDSFEEREIDYSLVNNLLEKKRDLSVQFLKEGL